MFNKKYDVNLVLPAEAHNMAEIKPYERYKKDKSNQRRTRNI